MKKIFPFFTLILLLGTGCSFIPGNKPIACTEEAKQCPDGSYVGRTGPKCEFAPCPPVALCEGGACPTTTTPPTNYPTFTQLGVTIIPLEVVQDSRCPATVQCIWAGTVEVRARVTYTGTIKEELLKLNTPIIFNNRQIELIGVEPAKLKEIPIVAGEYKFTFKVTVAEPVMCTMDAKLCPDGSYVGRTGPKCEFAPCPGT